MDGSHPLGITGSQVIVHRYDMDSFSFQSV